MTENPPQHQQPPPPPYPYPYPYPPYPEEQDEFSLLDYWKVIWKWKWFIIAIAFIATTISVVKALTAIPIYRAHVLLAPIEQDAGGRLSALASRYGGLAAMAGIDIPMTGGAKKRDESLAILQSRAFILKFIKDSYMMPILFEDVWDNKQGRWKGESTPTKGMAFYLFSNIISVSINKQTKFVTLAVEWKDSVLVAEWANKFVQKLNDYVKEQQVAEAEKNMVFLRRQLSSTNIEEDRAMLYDLIETNTKTIMFANVTNEFAFKVLDPAVVPEHKIKPKRKQMVIVGGMIGLMISTVLAFIFNYILGLKNSENVK